MAGILYQSEKTAVLYLCIRIAVFQFDFCLYSALPRRGYYGRERGRIRKLSPDGGQLYCVFFTLYHLVVEGKSNQNTDSGIGILCDRAGGALYPQDHLADPI